MKQVLVPKYFFNSGTTNQFSTDTTHANPIGFVSLDASNTFLAAAPTKDFAIMYRAGKTQAPNCIDVDYNSLEIVKSEPTKIHRTVNAIHIGNAQAGDTFTINIIKRGVTKHEKNIYRISVSFAKDTLPYDVATALYKQFVRINEAANLDITAQLLNNNPRVVLTLNPADYEISLADEATRDCAIAVSQGPEESLTLNEKELYRRIHECIGNRGVQYTYEFGETIYPFQEHLEEGVDYVVYTFRFAVPRQASKTRDEVVYQLVHFIVNPALTALTTFIEGIKSDSN